MERSFVYDIRTSQNALATLVNFTGIVPPIWEKSMSQRGDYHYEEDFVESIITKNGSFPQSYENWLFTYFHITTSANECESFKKYGILDLRDSYLCEESELRQFLNDKGIVIDIDNHTLRYKEHIFDISYGASPPSFGSVAYARWCIGRKLYYDFTTCGFLSVSVNGPYGGDVHYRPEILSDIDRLLNLSLSQEWCVNHQPYEIVAMVPGTDIVYDSDDNQSSREKVLNYLTKAYLAAFGSTSEEILLLKNNIHIPANRIIEINPLRYWR